MHVQDALGEGGYVAKIHRLFLNFERTTTIANLWHTALADYLRSKLQKQLPAKTTASQG